MTNSDEAMEVRCESHHWVSTNVPGLLARWVIQCSLCEVYNVEEMNAALSATGFGPVQEARAEAWDEGWLAVWTFMTNTDPRRERPTNPYREDT